MGRLGAPELIILVVILAFFVLPWWLIIKKTGNPPWLALLMLLPLVNVLMLFWLGLSEWPIERRLRGIDRS